MTFKGCDQWDCLMEHGNRGVPNLCDESCVAQAMYKASTIGPHTGLDRLKIEKH